LLNVHGHAHAGTAEDIIGKTKIFNPGALENGRYAELLLSESKEGIWEVSNYERMTHLRGIN